MPGEKEVVAADDLESLWRIRKSVDYPALKRLLEKIGVKSVKKLEDRNVGGKEQTDFSAGQSIGFYRGRINAASEVISEIEDKADPIKGSQIIP